MPFPTEHAARIRAPGKFKQFRRQNNKFGSGIDVIFGITSAGKAEVQTIRFASDKFTPAQARKWLSDNNYKPTIFEPASGNKELTMPDEVKEVEEKCGDYSMAMSNPAVPMGVTSFAQLQAAEAAEEATDEVHELASQFQGIVNNIMADSMLEDKAGAVTAAAAEFATLVDAAMSGKEEKERTEDKAVWSTALQDTFPDSSFLFIESGGTKDSEGKTVPRSKRHFVFADKNGKPDLAHLRNAIARIPQSNAPGLSAEKKASLQERARKMLADANKESWLSEAVAKVGEFFGLKPKEVEASAPEPKPTTRLMLLKQGDRYRWLAVFSNKYRDQDNPPEILASEAHKEFVNAVERGEWPYPELRHWHIKGTKWGTSDWLTYDEQTGFILASGLVDAGHEKEAIALAAMIDAGKSIKVSHGMPVSEIRRDKEDSTIITRYRTVEISDLPGWAAANPLTGFEITSKEGDMPIPESKVPFLKEAGVTDEEIEMVNAMLAGKAKDAEHLENKEAPEAAPVEPAPEVPAPTPDAPAPITREEILAAIQMVVTQLEPRFAALEAGQKELKEAKEVEAKDILAATPAFSLVEMLKGQQRAVGSPEAQVEKGTRVKGPKETKPDDTTQVVGIPFISQLLQSSGKQPEN